MYSKYILNSNWNSLSGNYESDDEITLKNQKICVDGNIDLNYSPFLTLARDYTNNNYSLLFLTDNKEIENFLEFKKIDDTVKTQSCLIASNYKDKKILEETRFLALSSNSYLLKEIKDLNESCFLECMFLDESDLLLYRLENKIYSYFSIDPFTENIFCLSSYKSPTEFTDYEQDKIKLNYSYYNNSESLVLYKYLQNSFLFFQNQFSQLTLKKTTVEELNDDSILFSLLSVKNLPAIAPSIDWVSYSRSLNMDNLNVDTSRSFYNLKNNFVFHFEYFNKKDKSYGVNILTLKNQLNYNDEVIRYQSSNNTLRDYNSILGGGKREQGYDNLNLCYTSDYTSFNFLTDKTTWFHLPDVKEKIIFNINDTNFFQNGAIAGRSPIFSDKVWKKNAYYPNTSNYGNSTSKEHTGQWLCAWLSGGTDSAVWVNRFYNPNIFTPIEALSYSPNIDYRPQFYGKYKEGINDIISDITFETGGWYAYSRLGKETAKKIIKSLDNKLISKNLSVYKNTVENDLYYEIDRDGESIYNFTGEQYGILPITNYKDNYNNFTLSFFASRYNWNTDNDYQIFGNYLNGGLGFFNSEDNTPVLYYLTEDNKKIIFNNNKIESILEIDIQSYLPGDQSTIAGIFYKNIVDNFFIITKTGYLLEFTSNGTIVDTLTTFSNVDTTVISCSNNKDKGAILLDDNTKILINLYTKEFEIITEVNGEVNSGSTEDRNILINNSNKIFTVRGSSPVIKGENIYFLNTLSGSIDFYDTNTQLVTTYLSGFRGNVQDFNFDKKGKTYVLYTSGVDTYSALGALEETKAIDIRGKSGLSAVNIGFSKLGGVEDCFILLKNENESFFYNIDKKTYKRVDTNFIINNKNYDFCFDRLMQSTVRNIVQTPIYKFKLKLTNLVNSEDFLFLETILLAENLGTGEHHFVLSLDTIKGIFDVYIDNRLYSRKTFTPGKYSFSNILKDNFIFGTTPFYGNITYNKFYKTPDSNFYASDLTIRKIKFYNKSFSEDEVKMLYFERVSPLPLTTTIKTGNRSYLDTVSRVFKNRIPCKKANLINLSIGNTNISDASIQQMYNNLIIDELRNVLPGYVKINKIQWVESKKGQEKMLEGYFNKKNTLTEN
jgi:hypothetical protein